MPIYEYHCESCGHEFEAMQKITDEPIRKCESCGKMKARRSISKTSFVLKGSGWYVTDYAGANASNRSSTVQPQAAEGDKKSVSESKDAKKAANE